MEYMVLYAADDSLFNQHVSEELTDGWQLVGGVSVVLVEGEIVYHQAIARKLKK